MRTRRVALVLVFGFCNLTLAFACGESDRPQPKPPSLSKNNKKDKSDSGGVIGGIIGCMPAGVRLPAPDRVRVSEKVERDHLISSAPPTYPEDAKKDHVEGKVQLKIVVAKDGTVSKVEVFNGPAALTQAAMDSVRKYKFSPYMLNGAPVEVECLMTVPFTLRQN